jgi:putative nucleotidyltransferase with HDIG domain
MFQRILKGLRSRSIGLTAKIMLLIFVAVVASLSLTDFLLYANLRTRTYKEVSETLLQVASTAAANFDASQLSEIRSPSDSDRLAYRRGVNVLGKIWKENNFDRQDKWERLSIMRYDSKLRKMFYVLSPGGSSMTGKTIPLSLEVTEAALKGEAIAEDFDEDRDGWLTAYAPIRQTGQNPNEYYFVCAETSVTRLQNIFLRSVGQIALASLAGLAIALLGGWLLTEQITKPMRTFVDVMRLMQSTGDFDLRIDVHPEDKDMSLVEETFTSLIAKVRESRRKEESSYWSTLQALVTALDVRDNETAGHSVRVTRYSMAIAERMRVGDTLMEQVRQGALLHDIGKIGVPDAILRKNGKLTEAEWKEMQKHPLIGKSFLEDIEFLRAATAVVYCHHERWDGSGYPGGLSGEAIPLAARIFAVADALDTITSDRYYKKAQNFRHAREEIDRSAGTHFDPTVVKAFMTLPEKTFLRIRLDTNMAVMQLETPRKTYGRV